jgi:hypothetical protein
MMRAGGYRRRAGRVGNIPHIPGVAEPRAYYQHYHQIYVKIERERERRERGEREEGDGGKRKKASKQRICTKRNRENDTNQKSKNIGKAKCRYAMKWHAGRRMSPPRLWSLMRHLVNLFHTYKEIINKPLLTG